MPLNIPTTKEIKDINIANYEASLSQDAPLQDKAFLRVKSAQEAFTFTALYKYAAERALQNLILTATGQDLVNLGNQYNVPKRLAEAAILEAEITGEDGSIIETVRSFVGNLNGLRYTVETQATIVGGVATITLTATQSGVVGNLEIGNTLTIDSPVAGINSIATVTAVNQLGTEEESDDVYRLRILDVARASGGGGNASDYRRWAQETPGVARAYPFSGKPVDVLATSSPPDRTVYIKATTDIDPDGIAPQALLDAVRDTITTDPETGLSRQPLGLTNETLFIESISRTDFYVTVRDLQSTPALEAQVKQNIADALTTFFASLESFVPGLDPLFARNDLITDLIVSDVVQDVLKSDGASASSVGFGLTAGNFISNYRLQPGELAKFIQVDFE